MSYSELEMKVIQWSEARKIIQNSTSKAQAQKTVEESGELLEASTALYVLDSLGTPKDDPVYQFWIGKFKDAAGDVVVTVINACAIADVDLVDCLALAYDEIKDRKGYLHPNGKFIKE